MSIVIPNREPYPSDLTDEQWQRIASLIPPEKRLGRRRETDPREIVNAINYRWTTGCAWRMLPHDFPPWTTIYTYFRHWQCDGTLSRLREELLKPKPRGRSSLPSQNSLRESREYWPEKTNPRDLAQRECPPAVASQCRAERAA